jgi:hypothetical protein
MEFISFLRALYKFRHLLATLLGALLAVLPAVGQG